MAEEIVVSEQEQATEVVSSAATPWLPNEAQTTFDDATLENDLGESEESEKSEVASDKDESGDETEDSKPPLLVGDEPPAAQGHDMDKGLTHVQQRVSSMQSQQEERFAAQDEHNIQLDSKLDKMLEVLESRTESAAEQKATDSHQSEIDSLTDELEALESNDELVEGAAIAKTLKRLLTLQNSRPQGDRLDLIDAKLTQQDSDRKYDLHWSRFEQEEGFDGRGLWETAVSEVQSENPNANADYVQGIANERFFSRVAEQQASPTNTPKTTTETAKKKSSRASTKGTQIVSTGASSKQASTVGKGNSRPPSWVPDG